MLVGRTDELGDGAGGAGGGDGSEGRWRISPGALPFYQKRGVALYLHIPFCRHRCDYCAFYSLPLGEDPQSGGLAAFQAGIIREILGWRSCLEGIPLTSVYIGGGTPSVIPASLWPPLLQVIGDWREPGGEMTVEANPESLTAEHLAVWQEGGVSRLSLGIQSFRADLRKRLGRRMADADIERCRGLLSSSWAGELSLDWMVGIPRGGDPFDPVKEGEPFLEWTPDHISCYELSLEEGTPLARRAAEGGGGLPGEEERAVSMEGAARFLEEHGYRRYEVSNFSKPRRESRHNLQYWDWYPYLGIGPGAHSLLAGNGGIFHQECRGNPLDAASWSYEQGDFLSWTDAVKETLMMGLRLTAGIRREDFFLRYGRQPEVCIPRTVQRLEQRGWLLERREERWGLNPAGRQYLNRVLVEIFDELDTSPSPGES